jgi:hypothetical protein
MRGDNREGRFNIAYERGSNVSGTTVELVQTVGQKVDWWIFDPVNTAIDPIYDVGSSVVGGGRKWLNPFTIPVVNAHLEQGATVQGDRGFYNTDLLTITINIDVVESHLNYYGANASNVRELSTVETNPDLYLRDRIVFRNEVFSPTRVLPQGILKDKYTLLQITCEQVNAEELVNDSQFQHYANYSAFNPTTA